MGSSWLRGGTGCRGSVSLTDSEIIPPAGARRGGAANPLQWKPYEIQTGGFGGSAGGGGSRTATATAGAASAPGRARHARRGSGGHGVCHGSRHAHVYARRECGGCRGGHHAGGSRGGVLDRKRTRL